ncbi:MAG: hypothetical protein AAF465_13660 [Pseudomonadota bacterium]
MFYAQENRCAYIMQDEANNRAPLALVPDPKPVQKEDEPPICGDYMRTLRELEYGLYP